MLSNNCNAATSPDSLCDQFINMMIFILISAASILVSAEVMVRSVKYERQNLPKRHPKGAYINYGYSFVLAWIVFAIYVIAAIVFLVFSRKRKGDKAADEREAMENEPVHLGRI